MSSEPIGFDLLGELGVRGAGRDPAWKLQTGVQVGAPSTTAQGVSTKGAINARIHVALREDVAVYGSRVVITVFAGGGTYTVTVNGNAVVYDASAGGDDADIAESINGIADAINGDGTVNLLVSATVESRNGTTADTVVLRNKGAETVTHTTLAVGSVGATMDYNEDALTVALVRAYELPDTDNDTAVTLGWAKINEGEFVSLDFRGISERLTISGSGKVYAEIGTITSPTDITKAQVVVHWGPGGLEEPLPT